MKPNLDADEAPVNSRSPRKTSLYKSLAPCCRGVNPGVLPLGEPPGKKQFVNGSSAFKLDHVWCGSDWHLHQLILRQSAESVLRVDGKVGLLVFMQQKGYRGKSSLTKQAELTLLCWFTRSGIFITAALCNWPTSPTPNAPSDTFPPCFSPTTPATSLHYSLFPLSVYLKQVHVQSSITEIMLPLW